MGERGSTLQLEISTVFLHTSIKVFNKSIIVGIGNSCPRCNKGMERSGNESEPFYGIIM